MVMCKAVPPMDPAALAAVPLIQQQPDQLGPFNVPTTTSLSLLQNNAMSSSSGHDDIQPDVSEIYFLVMHFLASGPCSRAFGQLWNELLQHKLLPRRFHAWVSRDGKQSTDENDDGASFPLSYRDVEARYPNIEKTHLVKLLQQLLIHDRRLVATMEPPHSRIPTAADAPTLLGSGAFSLLDSERSKAPKEVSLWTRQMRWPHWQADQVHGLMLRELGGGFARHSRAPTSQTACYVVLKPDILVDRIQIIKKLRGHRNAVYCAIFDRTGQYVITGSDDRLVKIWSSETGLCLRSCRGHEGDITDMAVSSGNTLVASASNDCSIRIWRLPDGVPISVLRGHTSSVTAITFSPRQGCEHLLLSTSDDGTCRIWDALDSSRKSRVYMPSPKEPPTNVKGPGVPPPPAPPIINQVICCAFNADGSIFVTGSSDKIARVWDACKWNDDVTGRPNHELDTLRGHEHDVNYVQFSGCAAPARPLVSDVVKKDYPSQFKNSWFGHASIVTCSRDGSAIIWTPRPRKYHGKVGRWVKAYHLRVPPPPMPPPAPRGNGPRQRLLPTPRGVNMIVWSLDNRFVLAAIMDHRICVWNAVDGSLVHSLTGHDKQTYVLDVHPFNPRIAMSAGYDGRVIIWDIWEGHPIKVYETGEYNLVDGHFSPDGSSLVVSDEVGQIYVFGTGPEMSQKDVKYDQFFLGDFRPLVRDAFGNVLDVVIIKEHPILIPTSLIRGCQLFDKETQLAPHVRNIQDLLCDASLIPYPEPYQSTYQQRRLGTLGINWTPPSVHLAIGATDDAVYIRHVDPPIAVLRPPERHERQGILTGVGGNRWVEQPSEVGEAMDWEQEVVAGGGLSEDTGSNYSASEESQSDEEEAGHSGDSLDDEGLGSSDAEEGVEEQDGKTNLRRSCRNKRKLEEHIHTASGRRVRRQILKDNNESSERGQRHRPSRAPRPGTSTACVTTHQASSSRPRRLAARNALNLFSSMNSNEEAENNNPVVAASSRAAAHEDGPQALDSENRLGICVTTEEPALPEQEANPAEVVQHELEWGREKRTVEEEEVTIRKREMVENAGECRRPRSHRRLVLKLRNGGPPRAAADGFKLEEAEVPEEQTAEATSVPPELGSLPLKEATSLVSLQLASQRIVRKLVVKPPSRPMDPGIQKDKLALPRETWTNNGKAILSDSDEGFPTAYVDMSHDEKLKQEQKKAKAGKFSNGYPNDGRTHHGSGSNSLQSVQNCDETCSMVQKLDRMCNSDGAQHNRTCTLAVAASPLKPCAHNGDVSVKENGHENNLGHQVNKGLDFLETQNHPEDGKSKSETCVENKGLEASYFAKLPTWSMGNRRTLGRPQYSKFVVCDVEDDLLQTATDAEAGTGENLQGEAQSHQQEDKQDHLRDGQNKNMDTEDMNFKKASSEYTDDGTADTGCQANKNSQDMDVHNRNNILEESVVHVAASTEEFLQAKDSDTEQELSVKSVLPNSDEEQVDVEEHHESCLALQERAPTLHVTRSRVIVDKPSSSRIRRHQPTRLIAEWEAMGDEQNHGDDQEEGDKGTSHSDLCDDTCPSTQDWSDSGEQDTADESAEVSQGRHHMQRHHQALGKLGSYTGQASSSERRQQLNNLETSPRTRRVRRMPSALDENYCETRSRGNHEQPTQAISGAESTPGASSMWGEEKEILIKDGSKSWQNGSTSARCLRPRQPANNMDATLSGSDIERPSWTEPRSSRVAPKEEGKESSFECDHRLEYYGNEKAWHLTGHQRQKVSQREKGMASRGDFGTWGQRGGRRSRKFATRSRTLDTVAWLLTEEVELGTRFIPQFGDEVVYLRQGHQEFLQKAKLDEKGPWRILKKPVGAVEFCRIISLDYMIEKPSQKTSCKLELQFTDVSSEVYGKSFKLTLLELTDHPDFLVERTRYDTSMNKGWRARDHCQVWWACEENGKAGSWWEGRIKLLKPKSPEFPESPWEMYHVMYKGSSAEPTAHSPWELFEKNYNLEDWQLPSIDEPQKESLKTIFDKLQYNAVQKNELGLEKLQEDMYNIEYINRIALPLSFDTISARVERDYYHSVQAFEHDVKLMVSNAQTFYGNDTMEADRIEELADELLGALQ